MVLGQVRLQLVGIALLSLGLVVGCAATEVAQDDFAAQTPTPFVEPTSEAAAPEGTTDQASTTPDAATSQASAGSDVPVIASASQPLFAENGVAIRGADPVAYFTQGAYVPGSPEFTHSWSGATWHFASAENRNLFASNPAQYAPQYGGFCAWAVSQGYTAPVDPNAWKIVDSKLYLNYSQGIQRRWERDLPGNIAKGDANWPGVAGQQ